MASKMIFVGVGIAVAIAIAVAAGLGFSTAAPTFAATDSQNAGNTSEATGTMDKVNLRLKWLHQAQFAGFYTADQKGFYEKNGIDVTINPGGVDFPAVQMVASGSEHFGVTGADQILIAREKGV